MSSRILCTIFFLLLCLQLLSQASECSSNAPLLVVYEDCRPLATRTSREAGDVLENTCGSKFDDDVWFRFEAISNITSILLFTDQDSDIGGAFYQDCRTELQCIDTKGVGGMERMDVETFVGTEYFVQVYDVLDGPGEFLICLTTGDISLQSDCKGAVQICDDGPVTFTPGGSGTDDFAPAENQKGCLLEGEHQSAWYYFEMQPTAPPNQLLTFTLTPDNNLDLDFAVFGPNLSCDELGFPLRCSWADANCQACPLTGLGMDATDVSEGTDGDGFLAPLLVQPGQGFYLLIDLDSEDATGFLLEWGGSAAPYLNCEAFPPCGLFAEAGGQVFVCEETEVAVMGNAKGQSGGFVNYQWTEASNSGAVISNPRSANPTITLSPDFSGTLSFYLNVSNNSCSHTDVLTITKECDAGPGRGCPTSLNADIDLRPPNCIDAASGQLLVGAIEGGLPPYDFRVDGGEFQTAILFEGLTLGRHTLSIRDASDCSFDTLVEVLPPTLPELELGPDLQVNQGDLVELAATVNLSNKDVSTVTWSGVDHEPCVQPCLEIRFSATGPAALTASLTTQDGCEVSDVVFIDVALRNEVFMPTVFSPNGDGVNDRFVVFGSPGIRRVISLQIFDRWGNLLFLQRDFPVNEEQYGWDGSFKGQAMGPGVFLYLVEVEALDLSLQRLAGAVTLL